MGLYHGYGSVIKEYKTIKPSLSMCSGCRDNFYNGMNDLGVKRCWSFESAKVVDKLAYPSINTPGDKPEKFKKTLSCYHATNK